MCAQWRPRSASASAQSDQSLPCAHEGTFGPQLAIERTAKTDQTGRMPRLIWVFAGRTCLIVGFVVTWLRYQYIMLLVSGCQLLVKGCAQVLVNLCGQSLHRKTVVRLPNSLKMTTVVDLDVVVRLPNSLKMTTVVDLDVVVRLPNSLKMTTVVDLDVAVGLPNSLKMTTVDDLDVVVRLPNSF